MWETYTPDGRLLVLRRSPGGWLATCLSTRAEAPRVEDAIRAAIGVANPSGDEELERWIAAHVAELEQAAG
jgi:hypothetical protein